MIHSIKITKIDVFVVGNISSNSLIPTNWGNETKSDSNRIYDRKN